MDPSLGRLERYEACGHEQKHWRFPGASEETIRNLVACDAVPFDQLEAMYRVAEANHLTVEVWQVAEHFDVPDRLAERSMRLFLAAKRGLAGLATG